MSKEDNLIFKYESLAGWIEKADTKAQILIGIQLFIFGYIIDKQVTDFGSSLWSLIIFIGFLLCSLAALYYLYRIIRPRLSNKVFNSKIYFRDIAKHAEQDYTKTKDSLIIEEEADFIDDMANQILSLAKVCNEKHEFLLLAEKFMVASFLTGLVLYGLSQIIRC